MPTGEQQAAVEGAVLRRAELSDRTCLDSPTKPAAQGGMALPRWSDSLSRQVEWKTGVPIRTGVPRTVTMSTGL